VKHFITIAETPVEELRHTLDVARQLKEQYKKTGKNDPILAGKTLAMIFEKASLRTRVSFEVGMTHLGGRGLTLRQDEVGIGTREAPQDIARVLSGMCDGIMARTFEHEKIAQLAKYATVPVINGLTDFNHPCQAMADVMTIEEHFGQLKGKTLAYIGDGNNVARSLAVACGKFQMKFIIATPSGYELDSASVNRIMSQLPDMEFVTTHDPTDAVRSADVVYTDTWVSMGQEKQKAKRIADFTGFQINAQLMKNAPTHAIVMHCLPAYRGMELDEQTIESPNSLIFPQAENRLHWQKGLLAVLMGGK